MKITFDIPKKEQILEEGSKLIYNIGLDQKWSKQEMGVNSNKGGIYIFHTRKNILYVGKTFKMGKWGNYNERLRRHCQSKASKHSDVFNLLKKYKSIYIYFINSKEIKKKTKFHNMNMTDNGLVLSYEQILIDYLNPVYEQNKVGYKNLVKYLGKKEMMMLRSHFGK